MFMGAGRGGGIYDSLNRSLSASQLGIIKILYPQHTNIVFKSHINQPDLYSCGVFAAAFATSLVLKRDPSNENYPIDTNNVCLTNSLRFHLAQTLETNTLSAFPATPSGIITFTNPASQKKIGQPRHRNLCNMEKLNKK